MKKDKLGEFYAGIEMIKNGYAYDKRYSPTKVRFGRPNIIIFTNTLPEWSLMSLDRWKPFSLIADYNTEPINIKGNLDIETDSDEEFLGATL